MRKSTPTTTTRVIRTAVFGEVTATQLQTLIAAGCELHSTDAPSDSFIRTACHAAGYKLQVHPAAWENLAHPSSKPVVKFNSDGTSREFNSNGGYTRDAVLAGSVTVVVLGGGLPPSRRQVILESATVAGVLVREITASVPVEYATPEAAAEIINGLTL